MAYAWPSISIHTVSSNLVRELLIAFALGLTMAVAVAAIGVVRGGPDIALVVALSMVMVVLVGSLIGMSPPFRLSRLNLDPATASAPLVTTIADAIGSDLFHRCHGGAGPADGLILSIGGQGPAVSTSCVT